MNTVLDETLPAALVEACLQLPPAAKTKLAKLLTEPAESAPPFEISEEWKAEILRRVAAVRSGEMKTYTLEETMAYLERVDRENRPK